MPIFNGYGPLTVQAGPGDRIPLFSATDSLAAGNNSVVLAIAHAAPFGQRLITFEGNFAAAPTAVWEIFGSNTYPTTAGPQNGVLLYTSTNVQKDNYTDNLAFAFYWAQLVSQSAGGALTLIASLG